MTVIKCEQETIINYNNEEAEADIFTYDRKLITKLKRVGVNLIDVNGDGSYFCKVPKNWVKVSPPRKVSDETKAKFGERAKKMWEEKNGAKA